jgi:hypothetical protein
MIMSPQDVLNFVYAFVRGLFDDPVVVVLTMQIFLNFVAAIAAAIATASFKWDKLIEVFYRKLFPLILIYAAARVVAGALAGVQPDGVFDAFVNFAMANLPLAALFAIEALLIKDLFNSLAQIPGLEGMTEMLPSRAADTVFDKSTYQVAQDRRRSKPVAGGY